MATNGIPRQILATITDHASVPRLAQEVDVMIEQARLDQHPGNDRELRIVDPPKCDSREHRRDHERKQHDRAQNGLERQPVVQQQREVEPEHKFRRARHNGVEDRIEDREPEHRVARERHEVRQADEAAALADLGVGHAEPEPEPERIGQENEQDHGRRNHEHRSQAGCGRRRVATPHFVFGSGRQHELVPSSIDLEATPETRRRAAGVQIS